jgi:hypothetical protein
MLIVGTVLSFSTISSAASFDLTVSASDNCVDIRAHQVTPISHYIEPGTYKVTFISSAFYGDANSIPINKVTFYNTTDDLPYGWCYCVDDSTPLLIQVTGQGTDADSIFAFFVDITASDNTGTGILRFEDQATAEKPGQFANTPSLGKAAAYPNPFSGSLKLTYQIRKMTRSSILVFDATGKIVKTIYKGMIAPGTFSAVWDGSIYNGESAPAGSYFVKVLSDQAHEIAQKVVKIK